MKKYNTDESRLKLAREISDETIVLLKNENNFLPLNKNKKVALFGKTQFETIIGGGGSGRSFSSNILQITNELKRAGIILEENIEKFYNEIESIEKEKSNSQENEFDMESLAGLVNSGMIYEFFGKYNPPVEEPMPLNEIFELSKKSTDTAIYVLGRISGGEECDRRVNDDYYLLDSEKELIKKITDNFENVLIVFNVNGPVDMAWLNDYKEIKSAVFMGSSGEQAGGSLADIITGEITPSGKLSQTLANSYEDYPTSKHMSYNKEDETNILTYKDYNLDAGKNGSIGYDVSPVTVYQESIYVGYRYFDTFNKKVMFPFGFGLSYTNFESNCENAEIKNGELILNVSVKNIGEVFSGKETIQVYVNAPTVNIDKPSKELKAFEKTKNLMPKESETLKINFKLEELASFDIKRKSYVIEEGVYNILIGNSSTNTKCVANIIVEKEIITRSLKADIGILEVNKFELLKNKNSSNEKLNSKFELTLKLEDLNLNWPVYKEYNFDVPSTNSTLKDVYEKKVSMESFINQMTLEELAVLCNGYGPGLPFGGIGQNVPSTIQYENGTDIAYNSHSNAFPGYINPALEKYGIYSACYKDGPASVGKTAWPTGMMISCTFNKELMYEFGNACGYEAEIQDVDSWLAPGVNIIRNPIGGRVFEYFSEDPYLVGVCGVEIAKGAMENNDITVCPKHFALNEQETYRRGSQRKNIDAVDSIADARTVREIYLKPFEMMLTQTNITTLMSSFNKINGTFAAGSKILCTEILRGEWGYNGVVVTDWGDMDAVVDGANAVAAGNDVVMPGGPPVIAQVLKGYEENRVTIDEMKTAVAHLLHFVINSKSFKDKM